MIRTNKQKLLDLVARMPEDVTWEEVAHRLELLRHIEIARQTALPDEAFKELVAAADDVPPQNILKA